MIDNQDLLDRITALLKLPIKNLKLAIFHKVSELEDMFKAEIDQYRRIKNMIEPEKETIALEKTSFELTRQGKKREQWTPSIGIPEKIIDMIISHAKPEILTMLPNNVIDGQTIDITCIRESGDKITGTFARKVKVKKEISGTSPVNHRFHNNKYTLEELKTFVNYLFENQTFSYTVLDEFFHKWKPLIDKGFFASAE